MKRALITGINGQDGSYLAIGGFAGHTHLWDVEGGHGSGTRVRTLVQDHPLHARVNCLSWNRHVLTTAGRSGRIHHHDVRLDEAGAILIAKLTLGALASIALPTALRGPVHSLSSDLLLGRHHTAPLAVPIRSPAVQLAVASAADRQATPRAPAAARDRWRPR